MSSPIPRKERAHCSGKSKRKYDEMVKEKRLFKTQAALFDISAAIGLHDRKKTELESPVQLVQSYSVDRDGVLTTVLLHISPELSGSAIMRELEKYAEYGVSKIYDRVIELGISDVADLDLVEWLGIEG